MKLRHQVITCLIGLGSYFEIAVASVFCLSSWEWKALGSKMRKILGHGAERGLAP